MSFNDLPLITDLLRKPHSPCGHPPGTFSCNCSCKHGRQSKPEPTEVDKRLRNWDEWMKERKKVHCKLSDMLGRKPGDLVMNSADELRGVKESQMIFDYTNIPEPDRQRGCPGFWKLPLELKDECGKQTSCFAVMPKEEKCEIPEIERVGVSNRILQEKDVLPRSRNLETLWKNCKSVKKKTKTVKEKLQQITPHKPIFDDLCVKGVSYLTNSSETGALQTELPTLNLQKAETSQIQEETSQLSLCLSINNLQLMPGDKSTGTKKIYISFDYDIITNDLATEYLVLKNQGNVAIRFYWKPWETTDYFQDIAETVNYDSNFCFNKNEGLILPGTKIQFPIWFKTDQSGMYYEKWELYTRPNVIPPNSHLIITFHAVAVIGNLNEKMCQIEEDLNKKLRNRLIQETLSSVLSNVPSEKAKKPIVYCYDKKQIFEAVNSRFNLEYNPSQYLYDKEVVRELENFYKKVRRDKDPKYWNYRIDELRLLTSAIERKTRNADRVSQEKSNISFDKSKLRNDHEDDEENPPATLTEELEGIISKLNSHLNPEPSIYAQIYTLLGDYFDLACKEFKELANSLGIVKITKYPEFTNMSKILCVQKQRKQQQLVSEDAAIAVQEPGGPLDKPPAECLQDIPIEDSKKRYRTYYNIPDTPPQEKQDKNQGKRDKKATKKEKAKKGGKKDKKPGKGNNAVGKTQDKLHGSDNIVGEQIEKSPNENIEPEIVEQDKDIPVTSPTPAALYAYRRNMYIIMYTYLCRAVDSIVDILESKPKSMLPAAVIKEVEDSNYVHRLVDLKQVLIEETVSNAKAKKIAQKYHKSGGDARKFQQEKMSESESSASSLWSVLRKDKRKPKEKLIKVSYPQDHYDHKESSSDNFKHPQPLTMNASTSTLDGRLDPNWLDFKDVEIQKDYSQEDEQDDLEAYIEKLVETTSVADLKTSYKNKETQKFLEDYVSDEEHFFDSDTDFSIDLKESVCHSENFKDISDMDKVCNCEGLGECNVLRNSLSNFEITNESQEFEVKSDHVAK